MATHPAARGWSYAEFARLPDDGKRHEIIAGEHTVTPSPRPVHQEVGTRLAAALVAFVEAHGLGTVYGGPIDVLFGEDDYLVPDLAFVRRERMGIVTDRGIEGAPDLVVEVISRSTAIRDRGVKRERYAEFGVPEYWIVDPDARHVEVFRLQENPGRPIVITNRLAWRPAPHAPALTLDVGALLSRPG